MQAVKANIELYRLTFIDLIEFGGKNTNRMLEFFLHFGETYFRKRLEERARQGELKGIDYEFFFKYMMVSLINFFSSSQVLPALRINHYSDEEISQHIATMILNGITR